MKGCLCNFTEKEPLVNGVAKIRHINISEVDAKLFNLRCIINNRPLEKIEAGEYVQLYVNGELMMSDTPMERLTNFDLIENARGDIMIAGLGIGMVLENLIPLCKIGVVNRVVVYEKYQDVIDLVAHRYTERMPLEVRCEDILLYKPKKDEKYDTLYFDIWPDVSEDNLKEINMLHNRWKFHKNDGGWMASWMADYLRKRKRRVYKY